jgi:hypothetical protein
MIDRRKVLLLAPALLAASRAGAQSRSAHPLIAPLHMPRDKPYVDVMLDGHGPYRFLLDTGDSAMTGIQRRLALELKLTETHGVIAQGVVGEADQGVFAGHNINIGGVIRQRDVWLEGLNNERGGLEGILPAHLFDTKDCEFDFEKGEFRLYLDGSPDRTGFVAAPYLAQNHHQIVVEGAFEDRPGRFQIDTGASGALVLFSHYVRRNRLWGHYPKWLDGSSTGVTGSARSREVKGSSMKVGPYRFHDPIVTLVDPEAEDHSNNDGLIGIDVLRRFTLSFDGPGHTLWLKPNDALSEPYRMDRAGIGMGVDGRHLIVQSLAPGAAAEKAGLKVGDRLLGLHSAEDIHALDWKLSGFPGDIVEIRVERAGQPETIKIVLEDRL